MYNCISNAFKVDSSKSDLQTCAKQAYKMKEENRQYECKKLCYLRYFAIDTDSFIRSYAHVNFHINRIRSFFFVSSRFFFFCPSSFFVYVCDFFARLKFFRFPVRITPKNIKCHATRKNQIFAYIVFGKGRDYEVYWKSGK